MGPVIKPADSCCKKLDWTKSGQRLQHFLPKCRKAHAHMESLARYLGVSPRRPVLYLLNAALSRAEREFTFNFLKIALMWLRTVNSLRPSFFAMSRFRAPVNRSSYTSA